MTSNLAAQVRLPPGVVEYRGLAYVPDTMLDRQKLDLFVPTEAKTQPVPVLVYIHGGGWVSGNRDRVPLLGLTWSGYAVASISYRYATDAPWPAQLDDCRSAIQFLVDHAEEYGLDINRFAIAGASAGGHLALMLAMTHEHINSPTTKDEATSQKSSHTENSPNIRAVVDWFGPTDLTVLRGGNRKQNPVNTLLGEKADDARANSASPLHFVDKSNPPTLIIHGDRDELVPYSQSTRLADAMKTAGADVELVILPNAGHGGPAFFNLQQFNMIKSFLDKQMHTQ
jgi:acetyl esterase/lipase